MKEAPGGFEPPIRVLQTRALPLGYGAIERSCQRPFDVALKCITEHSGAGRTTKDFAAGNLHTGFLSEHSEVFSTSSEIPDEVRLIASLKPTQSVSFKESSSRSDVWTAGPWRNA